MKMICSVEGCGSHKNVRRGLCSKHYQRVYKYGTLDLKKMPAKGTDRFAKQPETVSGMLTFIGV